jgi:uncharacterized protein (TIGR02270 family)
MTSPVIPAILDRHAEEAAFLWLLRDRAAVAPQFTLRTLAELDQRVEAHLDGLRVAGRAGWDRCWEEFLAHPEPGETFAAAVLALESADADALTQLFAAAKEQPVLQRALISAIGWLDEDAAMLAVPMLQAWDSEIGRAIGFAGMVARRMPIPTSTFSRAFAEPLARPRALRAIGELGRTGFDSALLHGLGADSLEVRFAAAWSFTRLSAHSRAISELQTIALTESHLRGRSASLAVRRLEFRSARHWATMLLGTSGCERVGLLAAGALGAVEVIPRILDFLFQPAFARAAAETIAMITGMDLARDHLEGDEPADFEPNPSDDPDDPNTALDPDNGLEWPDPDKVLQWWKKNQGSLAPDRRLLLGKPIAVPHLQDVLRTGTQRQRVAAALELAMLTNQPIQEVRAPGWRQ